MAAKFDFTNVGRFEHAIIQSGVVEKQFVIKDKDESSGAITVRDFDGYTGKAEIRDAPDGTLLAEFSVSFDAAPNSKVKMSLTEVQTESIPATTSEPDSWHYYDLLLTPPSPAGSYFLLRGRVQVISNITEP